MQINRLFIFRHFLFFLLNPFGNFCIDCPVKLLILRGHRAQPRRHSSFADCKAPGVMIPQMQASNLLENKTKKLVSFADDKAPGDLISQMQALNLLRTK